jgi:ketosteroid isomerase-like protein
MTYGTLRRRKVIRVLKELVAARAAGDAKRIAKLFAPNSVLRFSGSPELGPMTAVHKGRDAIEAAVAGLCQTWDFGDFPVVSTHFDGATAYSYRKGVVRHLPSGAIFNFEMLDRIVFKRGQIVEFVEFMDTDKVRRVAGA